MAEMASSLQDQFDGIFFQDPDTGLIYEKLEDGEFRLLGRAEDTEGEDGEDPAGPCYPDPEAIAAETQQPYKLTALDRGKSNPIINSFMCC